MLPKTYKVKGKYPPTKRFRTATVVVWNEDDLPEKIRELGLVDPLEISLIPEEDPSERQIEYALSLGIDKPERYSKFDLSAIISRHESRDFSPPSDDLMAFAKSRNMVFSTHIGKKALYNLVYSTLNDRDKLAFYAMSIYRSVTDDRDGNLDTHKYNNVFLEFADYIENNSKVKNKIVEANGERIRFFGSFKGTDGNTYRGSSTQSNEYKVTFDFLSRRLGITNNSPSRSERYTKQPKLLPYDERVKKIKIGCLKVIGILLLFWIGIMLLSK